MIVPIPNQPNPVAIKYGGTDCVEVRRGTAIVWALDQGAEYVTEEGLYVISTQRKLYTPKQWDSMKEAYGDSINDTAIGVAVITDEVQIGIAKFDYYNETFGTSFEGDEFRVYENPLTNGPLVYARQTSADVYPTEAFTGGEMGHLPTVSQLKALQKLEARDDLRPFDTVMEDIDGTKMYDYLNSHPNFVFWTADAPQNVNGATVVQSGDDILIDRSLFTWEQRDASLGADAQVYALDGGYPVQGYRKITENINGSGVNRFFSTHYDAIESGTQVVDDDLAEFRDYVLAAAPKWNTVYYHVPWQIDYSNPINGASKAEVVWGTGVFGYQTKKGEKKTPVYYDSYDVYNIDGTWRMSNSEWKLLTSDMINSTSIVSAIRTRTEMQSVEGAQKMRLVYMSGNRTAYSDLPGYWSIGGRLRDTLFQNVAENSSLWPADAPALVYEWLDEEVNNNAAFANATYVSVRFRKFVTADHPRSEYIATIRQRGDTVFNNIRVFFTIDANDNITMLKDKVRRYNYNNTSRYDIDYATFLSEYQTAHPGEDFPFEDYVDGIRIALQNLKTDVQETVTSEYARIRPFFPLPGNIYRPNL